MVYNSLYNRLKDYINEDNSRFFMPGHKGNFSYFESFYKNILSFDLTELSKTDNLFAPQESIINVELKASKLYDTAISKLCASGSTLCIQTMLKMVCSIGDKILMPRNVHISVINAVALLDLTPIWVYSKSEKQPFLPEIITARDIETALNENKQIQAVFITSPDYYGVLHDIKAISNVCTKRNVPLIVDNAHGAHLKLLPEDLHPITLGASMCCDSLHKTLPALTGAALIHISKDYQNKNSDIDFNAKIIECMRLFSTTSPSFLILTSIDLCLNYMIEKGKEDFSKLTKTCEGINNLAKENGFVLPSEIRDITRLSFLYKGVSGNDISEKMRDFKIEPEYSDNGYVVLITSPFNTKKDFERLERFFNSISSINFVKNIDINIEKPPIGESVISIRQAIFSENIEQSIDKCDGKIAAEAIFFTPPCVPLVMPGEKINKKIINFIKKSGKVVIKVVK